MGVGCRGSLGDPDGGRQTDGRRELPAATRAARRPHEGPDRPALSGHGDGAAPGDGHLTPFEAGTGKPLGRQGVHRAARGWA